MLEYSKLHDMCQTFLMHETRIRRTTLILAWWSSSTWILPKYKKKRKEKKYKLSDTSLLTGIKS